MERLGICGRVHPPEIYWRPFPKLSKFKNAAIVADIFSTPHRLAARHPKGINVVYANGAGKWVRREELSRIGPTILYMGKRGRPLHPVRNPAVQLRLHL